MSNPTPEELEPIEALTAEQRASIQDQSMHSAAHREETAMVSLGGYAQSASGKLTKSNYFAFLNLNLDDYSDVQMTPRQAARIATHLKKLSTGTHAMVPLSCAGSLCPFASRCPLQAEGIAPVGRQCIIELQLIKEYITKYAEEFDVDPANFTEVGYIGELAELMILDMRMNMNLARHENASLVVEEAIGVDREGAPIYKQAISPFIELKDRMSNRRMKIIKLMAGDRQEKWKKEAALKVRVEEDPSSRMATIARKLSGMSRTLEQMTREAESGDYFEKPLSPEDLISDRDE